MVIVNLGFYGTSEPSTVRSYDLLNGITGVKLKTTNVRDKLLSLIITTVIYDLEYYFLHYCQFKVNSTPREPDELPTNPKRLPKMITDDQSKKTVQQLQN